MALDPELLEILVCPACKGPLKYQRSDAELVCKACRLAYPIRKYDDGVYTRFLYDAAAAVPQELERRAKLSDKVLRWLTVKLEQEWAVDAKRQAEQDAKDRVEAAAGNGADPITRTVLVAPATGTGGGGGGTLGLPLLILLIMTVCLAASRGKRAIIPANNPE